MSSQTPIFGQYFVIWVFSVPAAHDVNTANSFNDFCSNKIVAYRDDITKSTPVSAVSATKENLFPLSNHNELIYCVPTTQEEAKKL